MKNPIRTLNYNLDQLVIWLRDNPNTAITSQHKRRIISLLEKYKNLQEEVIEVVKREPGKLLYLDCKYCGIKVNSKYEAQHYKACLARLRMTSSKVVTTTLKQTTKTKSSKLYISEASKEPYTKQYKEERRLDGSRDYWKRRDRGRYGSHAAYDDMSEESHS